MSQRNDDIVKLSLAGLPASKIRERLHLNVTTRQVSRIITNRLGRVNVSRMSELHSLREIRVYIVACMDMLGKDPYVCEVCLERHSVKCDIHHTKYEGATIYDLLYVCRSCNLARAGQGIS